MEKPTPAATRILPCRQKQAPATAVLEAICQRTGVQRPSRGNCDIFGGHLIVPPPLRTPRTCAWALATTSKR